MGKYDYTGDSNESLLGLYENALANNHSQKLKAIEKELLARMDTKNKDTNAITISTTENSIKGYIISLEKAIAIMGNNPYRNTLQELLNQLTNQNV